jgi:hypothetical protein
MPVLIEVTADSCADQNLGPLRALAVGAAHRHRSARPALTGRVTSPACPWPASIPVLRVWDDRYLSVVNGCRHARIVCNSTVGRADEGRFIVGRLRPLRPRARAPGFALTRSVHSNRRATPRDRTDMASRGAR